VYVWPELPEDVDIEIDEKDIRIDTFRFERRRWPARQRHRLRDPHHAPPDGLVVSCQNERSQHRNETRRCAC
jgi:protein subunit release factor A